MEKTIGEGIEGRKFLTVFAVSLILLVIGGLVVRYNWLNIDIGNSGGSKMIWANPNPVPAGSKTTTISWDTGDGSIAQVYISVDGGPEKRFSGSLSKGSLDATWIEKKNEYDFRLYAGMEHTTLLASVKVTNAEK